MNREHERLKAARIEAGYKTAKEFADKNGIAQSTYANHESGNRKLRLKTATAYGKLLNVDPVYILTGRGRYYEAGHASLASLSEDVRLSKPNNNLFYERVYQEIETLAAQENKDLSIKDLARLAHENCTEILEYSDTLDQAEATLRYCIFKIKESWKDT
ncbi:MAG: helix-turn-helix domain-containing protein [Alphaproteobacteria bacterium]